MQKAMPKRICFVITTLVYAGAQTQVLALAKSLKARGWDVGVVSMMPPEALTDELESAGIRWASLDMARGAPDVRALFRLKRILADWQPSIVHGHMVHANLLVRVTRLIARMPLLISTAHNINEGGRARELGYRFTDFLSELTTNVSQAAVDRYVEIGAVPRKKIELMVNGIDASRFVSTAEARAEKRAELGLGDVFTYLAVGRFEDAKDYPNMLTAFKKLVETQNAKLLIVGEGLLDLPQMVKDAGLESHVEVLGIRKDVPALMSAVDAYLMSSAWEGLPMVLLEAAASALPIVTTSAGGNAEVVHDGKTGFVVPIEDSPALAEAMLKLHALSAAEQEEMGLAGRKLVQDFYDLERIVDKWELIYNEQLSKKGLSLASA